MVEHHHDREALETLWHDFPGALEVQLVIQKKHYNEEKDLYNDNLKWSFSNKKWGSSTNVSLDSP